MMFPCKVHKPCVPPCCPILVPTGSCLCPLGSPSSPPALPALSVVPQEHGDNFFLGL